MLRRFSPLFAAAALLFACSSSTSSSPSPGAAAGATTPPPDSTDDTPPADPPPPPVDACGTVAKSLCTPANPGSVIRGVVKFDPAQYNGKKPSLRVFLHHQWAMLKDEDKHGGHPHAYTTSTDVDLTKGEARFTVDMCELGTAMWSEENCGFNLVTVLDETNDNDPDIAGQLAFIVKPGSLAKMTPLDVSCHAASPCLDITADCKDGEACTTYAPITSCKCGASSCPSDDKTCKP
jgi:hypothetical protein